MSEKPDYTLPAHTQNFVAIQFFEAAYKTAHDEQIILVETRKKLDDSTILFTEIEDQPVQASSIPDLILSRPDCISLSIAHSVPIIWNGNTLKGQLTEIYLPVKNGDLWSMKISLIVDGLTYESPLCHSLTEAMWELRAVIETTIPNTKWHLKICFSCNYCYPAFLGPTSERDELRCYRDAPEALIERQQRPKFASREVITAGHYFVNAFHRCAAWQSIPSKRSF